MRALLLTTLLMGSMELSTAMAQQCGCDRAPTCSSTCAPCCHRYRHHHHCCCSQSTTAPRTTRFAEAPLGPIVTDSVPVVRAAPTLVAMPFMPMMTQMRTVAFDDTL